VKASGPGIRIAPNPETGELERINCRRPVRRETNEEMMYRHRDQVLIATRVAQRLGTINNTLVPGKAQYVKDPTLPARGSVK
jgi:hypothetical protein